MESDSTRLGGTCSTRARRARSPPCCTVVARGNGRSTDVPPGAIFPYACSGRDPVVYFATTRLYNVSARPLFLGCIAPKNNQKRQHGAWRTQPQRIIAPTITPLGLHVVEAQSTSHIITRPKFSHHNLAVRALLEKSNFPSPQPN